MALFFALFFSCEIDFIIYHNILFIATRNLSCPHKQPKGLKNVNKTILTCPANDKQTTTRNMGIGNS